MRSCQAFPRRAFLSGMVVLVLLLAGCSDGGSSAVTQTPAPSIAPASDTAATGALPPVFTPPSVPTTAAAAPAMPPPNYTSLSGALAGSGSSLVNPLMQPWTQLFGTVATGVDVKYTSVGSGTGRTNFFGGISDFADSDVPASAAETANTPNILYIPMTLAGVVIAYNLPNVSDLRLNSDTVGKIFTGKITNWNDPAIAALNPTAKLPNIPIQFAVRQDSSGTTQVFTGYLSQISPTFKSAVGVNALPDWTKAGLHVAAATQNDGVAALLRQNPGTIGYVEVTFAEDNKLPYFRLQNAAGNYVDAALDNLTAAALLAKPNDDLTLDLLNQSESRAWPITTTTYVMLYRDQKDLTKAETLVGFLYWCTHDGQNIGPYYEYARLPVWLVSRVELQLQRVTVSGKLLTDILGGSRDVSGH